MSPTTPLLSGFAAHIENLTAQWDFLSDALDATDSDTPDWLAKELVVLKNSTNKLRANMERVRRELGGEAAAGAHDASLTPTKGTKRKASSERVRKKSPKRLSLTNGDELSREREGSPLPSSQPAPSADGRATANFDTSTDQTQNEDEEALVQYEDITEEVNARLRERRIRELMTSGTPATKRKRDTFEDNDGGEEYAESETERSELSELMRSPTKKLRTHGEMEQPVLKRKENTMTRGDDEDWLGEPNNRKKVKI